MQSTRSFLALCISTAMIAVIMTALAAPLSAAELPNIVLVMADDQGWGDVGYYGHPKLLTPNLDSMSRSGLKMDRFYAACPVCCRSIYVVNLCIGIDVY